MRRTILHAAAAALFFLSANASAATFTFSTDPFAGSTALTTPGRQIVGNELFTPFSIATDVFAFNSAVFGINGIHFANDIVANLATSGLNVIVLQTFDNDSDSTTPFGAGNAANLIAAQITSPGAGFFVYFNSGLDLARLVYSVDLNDPTSDLKIIARMTNLTGQAGRDAFPTFTAANFAVVPEPASLALMLSAGAFWAGLSVFRRRKRG